MTFCRCPARSLRIGRTCFWISTIFIAVSYWADYGRWATTGKGMATSSDAHTEGEVYVTLRGDVCFSFEVDVEDVVDAHSEGCVAWTSKNMSDADPPPMYLQQLSDESYSVEKSFAAAGFTSLIALMLSCTRLERGLHGRHDKMHGRRLLFTLLCAVAAFAAGSLATHAVSNWRTNVMGELQEYWGEIWTRVVAIAVENIRGHVGKVAGTHVDSGSVGGMVGLGSDHLVPDMHLGPLYFLAACAAGLLGIGAILWFLVWLHIVCTPHAPSLEAEWNEPLVPGPLGGVRKTRGASASSITTASTAAYPAAAPAYAPVVGAMPVQGVGQGSAFGAPPPHMQVQQGRGGGPAWIQPPPPAAGGVMAQALAVPPPVIQEPYAPPGVAVACAPPAPSHMQVQQGGWVQPVQPHGYMQQQQPGGYGFVGGHQ